ncbi:MAG: NAD(P)/FAD-dependent oxidoreductase [Pseudomonadota bacterium]|nr:NAD(P)/FAD-dependent oxidoreductase [Pseudomonadota bacterium]
MDSIGESLSTVAEEWLTQFEIALATDDKDLLSTLFLPQSHWRDLLAITWDITTSSGAGVIASRLVSFQAEMGATEFRLDETDAPVRVVSRGGKEAVIEAIYSFATVHGRGHGVFRLLQDPADGGKLKAWTLLTALNSIAGHEETVGADRPTGEAYSRDFKGPNWQDRRNAAIAYENHDPEVLVVGGGQAGLSAAARLTQLDVDTLIVDSNARVGDNWRKRYHALVLHNQVHVNHFPYLPFPPNWPTYIPKDKLAGWFEAYVELMELNYWTNTTFTGGVYDEVRGQWRAELSDSHGTTKTVRPKHIVMATSVSGIPNVPVIPTLEIFKGNVIHSGKYVGSRDLAGANVLIIGTGTSGHDIAQDLHSNGANPTLVQRSPTLVLNVEPAAQLPYTLYNEAISLNTKDLIASSMPLEPLKAAHKWMAEEASRLDAALIDKLENAGFRIDHEDVYGWQFKYMNRGGGYYFNVGCSDLVANGEVGLIQSDNIETFVADGVRMKDETFLPVDIVILSTGYKGPEEMVRNLMGEDVAGRVGRIWGWNEDKQELNNMWMRTGQPGLWFTAGSFAQCRIYSKYLGMQIKACLEGLIRTDKPNIKLQCY